MQSRMFLIAAVLGLAACSSPEEMEQAVALEGGGQSARANSVSASASVGGNGSSASASSSAGAAAHSEATDLYEFEYSWPAAAAIPGLRQELQSRMNSTKSSLIADAREGREAAQDSDFPYRPHSASWEWQVAADTARFLSLTAEVASFGGGAHGNYGKDVLLWDRQRDVTLAPLDLFASPAALNRAIAPRFCAELDRQRAQRRGMAVNKATPFGQCPPVEDLEVILGSADGEAFDRIGLYAAPYVAGAYAEGDYEITLPLDVAIMAAVKPQYRGAFSAR